LALFVLCGRNLEDSGPDELEGEDVETAAETPQERQGVMNDRMLQFFAYEHLPPHLQVTSRPFCELAHEIVRTLPSNAERTVALRKLLEAKDCAVRALLFKE
jgi:hypothetical protein